MAIFFAMINNISLFVIRGVREKFAHLSHHCRPSYAAPILSKFGRPLAAIRFRKGVAIDVGGPSVISAGSWANRGDPEEMA